MEAAAILEKKVSSFMATYGHFMLSTGCQPKNGSIL